MQLQGNLPLEIISTNSNSQVGWKDLYATKQVSTGYTTVPTLRITIPSGNPEIYLCTFWEQVCIANNGDAIQTITFNNGWYFRTDGGVDSPDYWGAANFNTFNFAWGAGSGAWSYTTNASRSITFNSTSGSNGSGTTVSHHISLFSTRLDLLTITWL